MKNSRPHRRSYIYMYVERGQSAPGASRLLLYTVRGPGEQWQDNIRRDAAPPAKDIETRRAKDRARSRFFITRRFFMA